MWMALGPLLSKEGLLELMHRDTAIADLVTEIDGKVPNGRGHLYRGVAGQRDDSRPRWDGAGWHEISSQPLKMTCKFKLLSC